MHRPRLFQSFSRSKLRQSPDRFDDHGYDYHNNYDSRGEEPSAWRKVLSRNKREESRPAWEEEVVEYPSRSASYAGPEAYHPHAGRYPGRDAYPQEHIPHHAYAEEHFDNDRSTTYTEPIPIVQRENSLSRMRDVFADHGRASHAVTELPLPSHRYTVADAQSPIEVHNTHPHRQQPVIVNNTTTHSVRPDMEHVQPLSDRARGKRPEHRRGSSQERYDSSPYEGEYPPCVVVVEQGRRGKPDTYYVIPGGAPVIFEDEHGNELTRVGDFSGKYRYRAPQRPVVIQDDQGNEIYRMGFDDSSSSRTRSNDDRSTRSSRRREHGHEYPSRDRYYDKDRHHYESSRYYDEGSSRHNNSHHGSTRVYTPEEYMDYHREYDHYDRHSSRRSEGTSRSTSPKVVYIDPSTYSGSDRSRGRSNSHASSHKSSRRHERDPGVVHVDAHSPHTSRGHGSASISSGESSRSSRH